MMRLLFGIIYAILSFTTSMAYGQGGSSLEVFHRGEYIKVPNTIPKETKKLLKSINLNSINDKINIRRISSAGARIFYNRYKNTIYFVNMFNNIILAFDENLKFIENIGNYGQGPGEYIYPIGIDYYKDGSFIITDLNLRAAKIYNNNFKQQAIIQSSNLVRTPALFDMNGNIIMFSMNDSSLFTIYDGKGKKIGKFGIPLGFKTGYEYMVWNISFNELLCIFDKEGYLYCTFTDNPILQRYNPYKQLIKEVDYWNIPGVKSSYERWLKDNKAKIQDDITKRGYITKSLIRSITVDDLYFYVLINTPPDNKTYILDKNNYSLLKEVVYENALSGIERIQSGKNGILIVLLNNNILSIYR